MYKDDFYPFYKTWAASGLYREESGQEKEFALMKSYYPEAARQIQEKVEKWCHLLDYEGSRIYDEYPDRFMLDRLYRKIREDIRQDTDAGGVPGSFLDELIQVILYQEITRRRCRRRRCSFYSF
ncbi:MAG: hypothetical protein LUF78_07280 [Clostridiales bacterium]|nr:hypothetical protein [Clostridiales bacterium]